MTAGLVLLSLAAAQASTLHGTVKNGTTGNPAAGVEVLLIQLLGGMETVANTKSDAQGQFTFDHASIGQQPMLVRAVYRGVNFHQPLPPGQYTAVVEVFDSTRDISILSFLTRFVVFQPDGSSLQVGEEYAIQNNSKPPQAYFRADGSFQFELPDEAELKQVAAWGPSGMPVVQATIDRGQNKYAVAFAFRPGRSGVRLSYQFAYPQNRATVRLSTPYNIERLVVLAPPSVEIHGDGLQPSGNEQGMNVYVHSAVTSGEAFEISVAGTAPLPSAGGGGPDTAPGGNSSETTGDVQAIPGRIDALKWPLIAGLAGLFVLGAIFLMRKPVPALTGAAAAGVARVVAGPKAPKAAAKSAAATTGTSTMNEMDAAVGTSLDALKEALFRVELRRQAGTISPEEYARKRAEAEKILRDLVKG